jgi:separase
LFRYFGHGGGDAYVTASAIRRLHGSSQCSASFLIGCSSGKIKKLGKFCSEGTFLNYLHAGCPIMLVNLWDVTDKDIDKFTESLFDKIGLWCSKENGQSENLAEAVNSSRDVCFLRHLNGAAPVVYGLPLDSIIE